MKTNDSSPCLFGIMAVELIELACLLALIATLIKEPGFQPLYASGLGLILLSIAAAAWGSLTARMGHHAASAVLIANRQTRQLNILSVVASLASIALLCVAVL